MLARSSTRLFSCHRISLFTLLSCILLEIVLHNYSYHVSSPGIPLDPSFSTGCNDPPVDIRPEDRENAVIVMLLRNSERDGAVASISSLEQHFNRWWHYPIVFLTSEAQGWDQEVVDALTEVASGEVHFETTGPDGCGNPAWIDKERATQAAEQQEAAGVKYGGLEGYHHMCRFYSGKFYDHAALRPYKWYWRVEPGVEFSCAVTYDPFTAMARSNKTYGYTIALWEVPDTAPSLFLQTSTHKDEQRIPTADLWRNLIDPSWAPFGLRHLVPSKTLRDTHGDQWNLCHYWGNFEIADMDFFREQGYRAYFEQLDRAGGFYYERVNHQWGDAPVRSLGAALFLEPQQLHYFANFGYLHPPFQSCPKNAAGRQLSESSVLAVAGQKGEWSAEHKDGVGCRCTCDPFGWTNRPICRNKLRKGVE